MECDHGTLTPATSLPHGLEATLLQAIPENMQCLSDASIETVLKDMQGAPAAAAVPHIFHQSWRDHNVSGQRRLSHDSFVKLHSNWTYRLWNDTENHNLIATERQDLQQTFNGFSREIFRVDMIRPVYLWKYGGVYADLDYEFFQNLEDVLQGHGVVLGTMQVPYPRGCWESQHALPNAFMAGRPGHPFWRVYLQLIKQYADEAYHAHRAEHFDTGPEYFTGPVMLLRALKCYRQVEHLFPNVSDVYVAPPTYFYPYSWAAKTMSFADVEKLKTNRTYAGTWWGHSWKMMH